MRDIDSLTTQEINLLVAKAEGLTVVGEAVCYHDPESGYPLIEADQQERVGGCMPTYKGLAHLYDCMCAEKTDIFDDRNIPMIHGHYYLCLGVVPDYCGDWFYADQLLKKHKIACYGPFSTNGKWYAHASDIKPKNSATSTELREAICKAVVMKVYGSQIDELMLIS